MVSFRRLTTFPFQLERLQIEVTAPADEQTDGGVEIPEPHLGSAAERLWTCPIASGKKNLGIIESVSSSSSDLPSAPSPKHETLYGMNDPGDEVRFSVELTILDGLADTYSLDIRRLRGCLRSYKFVYDTLRE